MQILNFSTRCYDSECPQQIFKIPIAQPAFLHRVIGSSFTDFRVSLSHNIFKLNQGEPKTGRPVHPGSQHVAAGASVATPRFLSFHTFEAASEKTELRVKLTM